MTDIEKLAAALDKHDCLDELGPNYITSASKLMFWADTLNIPIKFVIAITEGHFPLTYAAATGLIEGTCVVVPVEPAEAEVEDIAEAICNWQDPENWQRVLNVSPLDSTQIHAEHFRRMARIGRKAMIKAAQGDL